LRVLKSLCADLELKKQRLWKMRSVQFSSHNNKTERVAKTRRLFATLNRYAKPVSLTEIIALDEDDVVALTCRDLLENHPLFKKEEFPD